MRKNDGRAALGGMGGSIVSRNILEGKGKLKWCIKEDPMNPIDNGWRFLSDVDTDEFLSSPQNMVVVSWETVLSFEPLLIAVFDMPIGTDMYIETTNGKKHFYDTETDEKIL